MAVPLKTWAATPQQILTGTVTRILDGDTLTLKELGTGKYYRLRLASIDAPEKDQPYGMQSAFLLKNLVAGKYVEAHILDTDKYKRLVAHVFPASRGIWCKSRPTSAGMWRTDLCCQLLQQGAAWHLSYFDRFDNDYYLHKTLEQGARAKKIGLWANPYAIPPWQWRKKH